MDEYSTLILTSNYEHQELFTNFFSDPPFLLKFMNTVQEFTAHADTDIDYFLLDFQAISHAERTQVVDLFKKNRSKTLFVYNTPQNANSRLAFYDLGAKRVFDTTRSVEEIYFSVRWFINFFANHGKQAEKFSKGNLKDISLTALINALGQEKRSGALKIISDFNSGSIYFFEGHICDAQVGPFEGLEAVLHILTWNSGTFAFSAVKMYSDQNKISLSNIGILILSDKENTKYFSAAEAVATMNSSIRVRNRGDLKALHQNIKPPFLTKLEKPQKLPEIVENAFYTCFETISILQTLKDNNFLDIQQSMEESQAAVEINRYKIISTEDEVLLSEEDVTALKFNLDLEDNFNSKLLVLGSNSALKAAFMQLLTANTDKIVQKDVDVEQLRFYDQLNILVYGITIGKVDMDTIFRLAEGLCAYVMLFDSDDDEIVYESSHLLKRLAEETSVPGLVALYKSKDHGIEGLHTKLDVGKLPVVELDMKNISTIRNIFLSLNKMPEYLKENEL